MEKLILASNSARRKELLENAGYSFEIIPSDITEVIPKDASPEEAVKSLALQKAESVYQETGGVVIGADTIVVYRGEIIGKPKSAENAVEILKKLSGNVHEVFTGIAVLSDKKRYNETVVSKVKFKVLSAEFIKNYVESGKPMDKAGAYGIQDGDIAESYEGSLTNIIGLPMERITQILSEVQNGC